MTRHRSNRPAFGVLGAPWHWLVAGEVVAAAILRFLVPVRPIAALDRVDPALVRDPPTITASRDRRVPRGGDEPGPGPGGETRCAAQSGALGYFATGHRVVINLDGVVNHDAYEASRHHRLGTYIERRRIHWLVDNSGFVLGLALEIHRHDPTARSLGQVVYIRPIDAPALDVAHLGYASRRSIHS